MMSMHAPKFDTRLRAHDGFRADVIAGLSAHNKAIPAKYFYDTEGSRLFDAITELPEYYPTRTETALLKTHAAEITQIAGPDAAVVEFGAGSLAKARILLGALENPRIYVPIDLSADYLLAATAALNQDFAHLDVKPVIADFTQPVHLPLRADADIVGFFPGSTLGNFERRDAKLFLRRAARTLGHGSLLLIGVDTKKDRAVLERAYNDTQGITAAFNLNLLARINRELDGDFDLSMFAHRAFYNERRGRIEMHIESLRDQTVRIGRHAFAFARGETMHTENSYKYAPEEFMALAACAGWSLEKFWTDDRELFAVYLLRAAPD
jgi:dimethylhistidine N-methyltransferase